MNGVEGSSSSAADSSSFLEQNANYMSVLGMNGGTGFTFMQMEELKLQALIYKYMEAGLPVPSNLLLPIWNSVLASFTGSGCDRSLYDNYKNSMEAEPGRCKRTDGKKWRCSKEVVIGYKYCEKHLHRGRSRSRKDVEADSMVAATDGRHKNL
ncbi:growth-regulating factor 12 [Lactuca sativa]|uniref:growth-regulating factor 12 n=1 Tax=Lactuca sativa TaxID=4236 RepID=UPI000CAD7341|nr:growth-regulating factor 12 [Lactuca sativa]